MSDTTKIIPPPRRAPRWVDLVLAAVAGGLLVLVVLGVLTRFPTRLAGATPSPTVSASGSTAPSPSSTFVIQTAAPTTEPPSATPSPAATSAPPTPAATTAAPTPRPTNTPNPTKTP